MKAILEFNLPEDSSSHKLALSAGGLQNTLIDLDQWLRAMYKYQDIEMVSVESVRQKIGELLEENEVSLYE